MPKAQVLEITCPEDVPPSDPDRVTAAKHVELEVIAPRRRGVSGAARPSSCRRSATERSTYINGAGGFFALWTDDLTRYINKLHVRLIRPLD